MCMRWVCPLIVCIALAVAAPLAHAAAGAQQTALDVAATAPAAKAVPPGSQPRAFQLGPSQRWWSLR